MKEMAKIKIAFTYPFLLGMIMYQLSNCNEIVLD